MSNWRKRGPGPGPVPPRWLDCPRKAVKLVHNKFLAFKTPLSSEFDSQVPEECQFTVDMLFASVKSHKLKMGLWIDLTNTSRFYDKKEIEKYGCKYLKLQCRGHGETPSKEQTTTFIRVCENFIAQHPLEIVGVHCTHGFNRTGFLVISYLVEIDARSVDAALAEFASARPPGIYKGDYIQELFKRYDEVEDAPPPPVRPAWCLEYDDSNVEDRDDGPSTESDSFNKGPPPKKRKREFNNKNPVFMAGVQGVTVLGEGHKLSAIQSRVQELCSWKSSGFPGSQPVSMDMTNIRYLHKKPYRVSWKADGTRYMMLIQTDGEIFFLDRDNSVFQVTGLRFPHPEDTERLIEETLLDGEMVIDKAEGKEYPRYLAYDVITYDGHDVSKLAFHPDRYSIIENEVIAGRHRAMKEGRIRKEQEPFSVRLKHFWDVTQTGSLLSEKFAKQLSHEPDGLIFQPAKEPYVPGQSPEVLKWKPASMNSVDFKLKIVTESGEGIVPKKVGQLYVGGLDVPFNHMKISKAMKDLDNKIIECKFEDGRWVFMRERTDKSFPNSYKTATAVCKSIQDPVTKDRLLDYINRHRFPQDDADLMPPPSKRRR
ncbi:mRNA-capping enzyme [Cephus cinctus]|uniref:mRNA-capping enzyme n=1 Tax=Cephus cinctus TaxID=211228 RepID=A0AAJ7W610_CEPCN|nr:mRNA-capping enzyme [Cephus cinctus]XP_024945696.1 mRNA-capping enzyme [Cephus cinctus]